MEYNKKILLLFLAIILFGGFMRFWNLSNVPPGLYPDEAMNGGDALQALESNNFKIFYPNNNGREGLYINVLAFLLKIFGPHIWVIRVLPAIIGTLTIFGLFLLAKELFDQRIALWASFFIATSFWHVNFSRIGFRAISVPLLLSFSFYFLFKGLRTGKFKDFIFGGIFFGIGFHTYIAFRFAPFLLVAALLFWMLFGQKKEPSSLFHPCKACKGVLVFLFTTFIVALPIGWYFLTNPQDFFGRSGQVSIFSQPNPLLALTISIGKTLAMFNIFGDFNWRHNYAGSPELFFPVGIFFIIGIILAFKRFKTSPSYGFIIAGFCIMTLPSILTYEGLPHALRSIGMLIFTMLLCAIGAEFAINYLKSRYKTLTLLLIIVLALALPYHVFQKYFYQWGQNPEVQGAFTHYFVMVGETLNKLPTEDKKYVIVNDPGVLVDNVPVSAQTVKFVAYEQKNIIYINPSEIDTITLTPDTVIIPMTPDTKLFEELQKRFYNGLESSYNEYGVLVFNYK